MNRGQLIFNLIYTNDINFTRMEHKQGNNTEEAMQRHLRRLRRKLCKIEHEEKNR